MIDDHQCPDPVTSQDLWMKIGENSAKLDVLLDQVPSLHKRVRSLERSRTQIFTGLVIIGAAISGAVTYSKTIITGLFA